MILDQLNLNHIRIFESVFRHHSMTLASEELHLTQSGVSQHIKTMEDMLGVRLFDRIKQRLVPTAAAALFYEKCSRSLQDLEQGLWQIRGGEKQLSGTVTVGMPVEFGINIILPALAKFGRKNPLVKFKLRPGLASMMNEQILGGALDFAFVDDIALDRRITVETVYDEVIELCISDELLKKKGAGRQNRDYFQSLDYVEYQEGEPILRLWATHHLPGEKIDFNVRAVVGEVQGIARLIQHGMGAGVLPGHLILKLQKEGIRLHRFKGCGKPLKNRISVASLRDRTQSPAALATLEGLRGALETQKGA